MQKSTLTPLEYPILQAFRLQGRWVSPSEKTIHLLPQQTAFLIQNGKLGAAMDAKVSSKPTQKEGK
ncbi:hypothetical protein BS333_17550 [Vibrio azureus]|uniref:Uncharacterized protein n=1 Tax=Vibrio azureus NBRC 104587 TaxID=1219077 RepID=U3A4M1_9VIBR|nr:hypothetical protein BS333_17550 [Vibrio azureus]GAD74941.1 hypothetical protein VAZ01S_017_00360 [Vibrio azureus NBRC 104587]